MQSTFKTYTSYCLFFMIAWSLHACDKKTKASVLVDNPWEVVKIKEQGDTVYTNAPNVYVLEFVNESLVNLQLDVNQCSSTYQADDKGTLNLNPFGCTFICCDSEFSEKLLGLFPSTTSYYVMNGQLFLEGQGTIVLKEH